MKGTHDRARFITVMVWLSTRMKAQGGKPIDMNADLQDDYFEALEDLPIQKIEWAAKQIFRTETWFPMPEKIRAAAMIAPSSVMPKIVNNQTAITEFTEQQRLDASKMCDEIINGFGKWGEV
jgi:hypothetical protein